MSATFTEPGCYVDGHHGRYGMVKVIDLAKSTGMQVSEADQRELDAYVNTADEGDLDVVVELADEAEGWLNQHTVPTGMSFGWFQGEFFLWTEADWQDADG